MKGPKEKKVKFPAGKKSWGERIAYLFAARETLRREHNERGADYQNGLITAAEWHLWVADYFEPASHAISAAINELKFSTPAEELDAVKLDEDLVDA